MNIALAIAMTSSALIHPAKNAPYFHYTSKSWIRVQATGAHDKPFPIVYITTKEKVEIPFDYFDTYVVVDKKAFGNIAKMSWRYKCDRRRPTRGPTEFGAAEISEGHGKSFRVICLTDPVTTCRYLGELTSLTGYENGDDRISKIKELQTRFMCPEGRG